MKKEQINIRVSPEIRQYIHFLSDKYGSITKVIEVAVVLLYTQFVNTNSPEETGDS